MAYCLKEYWYGLTKNIFMKKLFFGLCALLAVYALQSCGSNNTSNKQDSADSAKTVNKEQKPVDKQASDFAVEAANGSMTEVELGKVAQEKAMNKRVKDFGAMMVKDHSEANARLKGLAADLNITLPDSVSADAKKDIDKLSQKKGKDFDKAYMNMMLDDHKKDVAEFRKAADNLPDSTIKNFASTTLPVLEKHLDSAQAITAKK
jgi:putative membrane protein